MRNDHKRCEPARGENPRGTRVSAESPVQPEPPDSDYGSAREERLMGQTASCRPDSTRGAPLSVVVVSLAVRIEAVFHDPSNSRRVLTTTTRPHDAENHRESTRNDESPKPMGHKACRCITPILQAREMATRNLHTADATTIDATMGQLPPSKTTRGCTWIGRAGNQGLRCCT